MLFALRHMGVKTADIVLHAGLSSYLEDAVDSTHPVPEEEYFIGQAAAEKVNQALMGYHWHELGDLNLII